MLGGDRMTLVFQNGFRNFKLVDLVSELKIDFSKAPTGHNVLIRPLTSGRARLVFSSMRTDILDKVKLPFQVQLGLALQPKTLRYSSI